MARMILATPEFSDGAVLSTGAAVAATLPLTNLQTQQPGAVARFTDPSAPWFEADLGAARAVDLIALLAHNGSGAATWRVRAASSQAGLTASPGYDSGSLSMWPPSGRPSLWDRPHSLVYLAAAETWRWWRIDLADGGNADGWFEAGRLYLSAAWQPARNLKYGASLAVVEDTADKEAAGGQLWPELRGRRRRVEFSLDYLSQEDAYRNALAIDLKQGSSGDVLFCRDPAADEFLNHDSVYGLLRGQAPIVNAKYRIYQKNYRIEELVP